MNALLKRLPGNAPAWTLALFFAGILGYAVSGEVLCVLPAFAALFLLLLLRDMKTAWFVLLATVPLSVHLSFANDRYALSVPAEPVMFLFFGLGVLLLLLRPSETLPGFFRKNVLAMVVLLQFLWIPVTIITSEVPLLSLKFLIAKSWYLLCFFVMPVWWLREKRDFKILFCCWLFPLLLYMVIILVRHAGYGFQFFYIDAAVGELFYKHVDYASVVSMFAPFVWAAYKVTPKQNRKRKNALLILCVFFLAAIVLSFTRAAMGGIVFAVVVAVAIRFRKVNWLMPGFYAVCLSILIFFAYDNKFLRYHPHFRETYMHHEFGEHLKATVEGKDMSSVERLYRWIAAFRMGADRPLTGFGPHAFYFVYKPYTLSAYRTYVSENYERSTTHNYFLLMLAEQGLPAMLLYGLLILLVFGRAQYLYHRIKDSFYRTAVLAVAMAVAVFFVNNFFSELVETDKVGPMFYLCLSMLIIIEQLALRKHAEVSSKN